MDNHTIFVRYFPKQEIAHLVNRFRLVVIPTERESMAHDGGPLPPFLTSLVTLGVRAVGFQSKKVGHKPSMENLLDNAKRYVMPRAANPSCSMC